MKKNSTISKNEIEKWYSVDLPELKPPIYAHSFIVFSVAFAFVALIYSSVVEIPSTIEVAGKLIFENPSIPVRALQPISIYKNNLEENKQIRSGEIIVRSSMGVSPEYLSKVENLSQAIDDFVKSAGYCQSCFVKINSAYAEIDKLGERKKVSEIVEFFRLKSTELSFANAQIQNRYTSLNKVYSEIAKIDQVLTQKRGVAQAMINSSIDQKNKLSEFYSKETTLFKQDLENLKNNLNEQNKMSKLRWNELENREAIRSPISGKIINLKIKGDGELIGAGQLLFEIVPDKNELIALLDVSNRDISSIKQESEVDIILDAFPEFDYGKIKAQVFKVLEPENNESNPNSNRYFRVKAKLTKQFVERKKNKFELLNGMTFKARIYKSKETLLSSFIKTLFKIKDEIKN